MIYMKIYRIKKKKKKAKINQISIKILILIQLVTILLMRKMSLKKNIEIVLTKMLIINKKNYFINILMNIKKVIRLDYL